MNRELVYKLISKVYDLLDVIYFRDFEKSPRKVVLESIAEQDRILDLCTGTATSSIYIAKAKTSVEIIGIDLSKDIIITEWEPSRQLSKKILFAPLHYLEPKSYRKFIKKDLYLYFEGYGLKIQQYEHCDYTKVVVLKKA